MSLDWKRQLSIDVQGLEGTFRVFLSTPFFVSLSLFRNKLVCVGFKTKFSVEHQIPFH